MRIKDVVILNDVADDLSDGRIFYDQKEKGIGEYFWDSLISDIESLFIYGGIHSKNFGLYRMAAKRFPYAIYYDVNEEIAYVVAVLPMRRDPTWIEKKLRNRD